MPIELICEECGESFTVPPSQSDRKYCSRECYLYENNPSTEEKVTVECDWCGSSIERIPSLVERTEKDFCNEQCCHSWRSENWTGEGAPNYQGASVTCVCEWCGEEYQEWRTRIDRTRFCSTDCRNSWQSSRTGPDHPLYQGGPEEFSEDWENVRRNIIEEHGGKCEVCGATCDEELIDVHHIVPRSEFNKVDESDKKWNLTVLCRSHHMKVERKTDKIISEMDSKKIRQEGNGESSPKDD